MSKMGQELEDRLNANKYEMYEALEAIIKHFHTLDKLYSKDLEMLNMGSRVMAKIEG